MTEWNASEYALVSGLQKAMAEEVLALLDLEGSERILDVGCATPLHTLCDEVRRPGLASSCPGR